MNQKKIDDICRLLQRDLDIGIEAAKEGSDVMRYITVKCISGNLEALVRESANSKK